MSEPEPEKFNLIGFIMEMICFVLAVGGIAFYTSTYPMHELGFAMALSGGAGLVLMFFKSLVN